MLNEVYKPLKDYEGIYEISNYGIIRRISYDSEQNKSQYKLPYYIKARYDKDGYLKYDLSKNGKTKRFIAHRLVALNFLENPNNLPCVNHKNGIKDDNRVENLEWCSIRDNNLHALKTGLRDMKNNKLSKQVEQYDMNGNLINTFKSANDAKRITGMSQGHISDCCRGETKQYNGYIWKYKVN